METVQQPDREPSLEKPQQTAYYKHPHRTGHNEAHPPGYEEISFHGKQCTNTGRDAHRQ